MLQVAGTFAEVICNGVLPVHELVDILDRYTLAGPMEVHVLRSELTLAVLSSFFDCLQEGTCS